VVAPADAVTVVTSDGKRFAGELDEDFEAALARVEWLPSRLIRRRIMAPFLGLVRWRDAQAVS